MTLRVAGVVPPISYLPIDEHPTTAARLHAVRKEAQEASLDPVPAVGFAVARWKFETGR